MPALNKLYKEYRDRAAFYVVYIQEAHPIDAWQVDDNLKDDVLVASTMTKEERLKTAGMCVKNLGIELPALVDDPDNRVERAYTAWPDRLYVIDRPGGDSVTPVAVVDRPSGPQLSISPGGVVPAAPGGVAPAMLVMASG